MRHGSHLARSPPNLSDWHVTTKPVELSNEHRTDGWMDGRIDRQLA